ncbi:unnamed protein product [Arabidopsis arenosa]|uniref:DNA helicase n=1 Tax=Arabidopsis arenosa TaxID=38785 RepID=A0A8S1ZYG3_ARAAE|nr:unnamed protein product [Arabidopsis arenosa]
MVEMESPTQTAEHIESMTEFLVKNYSDQLREISLASDPKLHYPLFIEYAELVDDNPSLAHLVFSNPEQYLRQFNDSAILAHKIALEHMKKFEKKIGIEKRFIHVRINTSGSPLERSPETFPSIGRIRVRHRGILLMLKGTVIRSGAVKMYEGERMYRCRKCKHMFPIFPELESINSIVKPPFCPSQRSKSCEGTNFDPVDDTVTRHDYQEIKIQENTQVLGVGVIPRSILVVLKDDLVDNVKAGDDVVVSGILTSKWSHDLKDVRCDLEPMLIANHVSFSINSLSTFFSPIILPLSRRTNELKSEIDISDDMIEKFKNFWSHFRDTPLKGRNAILRGICPQVFGLFTVKLAVALTLIGGVQHVDASGTKVRGESHLLLIGDPGTGKSQFLKFAAKLSNRAVITTGLGSTSAGLTVTAVKDGGEWMLEAGALVLADGGLCCIDEFDSMREHDRATIHEAMEQQSISVAKAGLVTTLSTKTIVFGATNPKGQYDPDQSLSVNTALSGPLLSRFDIVLVLLDTKNPEWDVVVSSHILAEVQIEQDRDVDDLTIIWPLPMLQRRRGWDGLFCCLGLLSRKSLGPMGTVIEHSLAETKNNRENVGKLNPSGSRNEVTRLDAITAILCIESSMTISAIVDSMGNALHSNFSEEPDQEYAKQEKIILEKLRGDDIY